MKLHSAKGALDTSMGRSPMYARLKIQRAESPPYLRPPRATSRPRQAVAFAFACSLPRSTGGGVLCRRSGETPASRFFNRTPQLKSRGSEPHVIPLGRSNNKIRPVHQDPNAAVLVHPGITRNVEDDLIPEKPTLSKAPIGRGASRIDRMRDSGPFRTYKTGPEKHNKLLSYVPVEYFEIPLLKISDALSGRRRNYDIETNASRSSTVYGRRLLRRGRNAKHHRRQARKSALVDEHGLTSTKASLSNSIPGSPSCAACPIHGAISSQHERTKHSLLGTPRLQPWASHSEATRGALAPRVCPPCHSDLIFLNAQSNFQSTTASLTPTIELIQVPTVRRKPDCTI
jgi:hypothetical protein